MKHILLPTDYSDHANNAFFYALNLANKFDVKLYVLFSYVPPVLSAAHAGQPDMVSSVYQEIENSRSQYATRKNNELVELAKTANIKADNIHFIFEIGTVLSSVKKVIDNEDISLVVMGVYGDSTFQGDIMGSNTTSVIRNIKLPVLAIPLNAKYKPIEKIGFTTLFKEKDFPALEQIVEISSLVNAKVYCVNVKTNTNNTSDVLLQSEKWTKTFKEKDLNFVFLEKGDSVEETVNHYILDNNIDVLAIVRRNRNFFERLISSSLSTKLTIHAEIPIFVFHEA
ncbi:universal stress protein [Sphingobacterium bovistauri]|uniref:Universal stress protein n=1 Tax=Sphingobacterium bovistauri TaxID=2781959 RepID=A0ABS7Z403_9SPHI|nr:universal stress protein [Sphingobacterium bovistauri]MCA5004913.1 universal stress protein [Sphingobacterium bovistauri]